MKYLISFFALEENFEIGDKHISILYKSVGNIDIAQEILINGIKLGINPMYLLGKHPKNKYLYSSSFSRDQNYIHDSELKFRFVINETSLRYKFYLMPYAPSSRRRAMRIAAEEVALSNKELSISPKYILRLEVGSKFFEEASKLKNPFKIPIVKRDHIYKRSKGQY